MPYFAFLLVLSLPPDYYNIIIEYIKNGEPVILSLGNVNRSDIGYLTLIAYGYSLIYIKENRNFKYLILSLSLAIIILAAGSKLPIIFGFLITFLLLLMWGNKKLLLFTFIAFIFLFLIGRNIPSITSNINTLSDSFTTRLNLIENFTLNEFQSSYSINEFLFGNGLGFSVFKNGIQMFAASSNIFIDIFYENGFIGLILFIYLLKINTNTLYIYRKNSLVFNAIIVTLITLLVKINFSSETYNEFMLLIFTGISLKLNQLINHLL
jgi:hypothetical protein